MSSPFQVRRVTADETRPLRQRILRPHQRVQDLVYAHDDDLETLHVGAFAGETMIGVATIYPEPMPASEGRPAEGDATGDWRVRGMATIPEHRRRGVGKALLRACFKHASVHDGRRVWCNARVTAAPFYVALDFATVGPEFELKDIGPHYLMVRAVGR